jgi:heme exporter protein D
MDPSWTQVALAALNVAQTVLLAYVASITARNRESLREIERRASRRRREDAA